jgi:hypothetical protein
MTQPTNTTTIAHVVNRLVIDADTDFEDLRQRYETLVPDIDMAALTAVIDKGNLDEVVRYTAERTPHSFARFWTFDPTPMMRLAGDHTDLMSYLMGNNVIAETMFRHTVIYRDAAGATHLSIDQPSTNFASFGDSPITDVGLALDAKLAALLRVLGLAVPVELEHD